MTRIVGVLLSCLLAPSAFAQMPCGRLTELELPDTTITGAQAVPAGPYVPPEVPAAARPPAAPNVPAFCRVSAVIKPTADSNIGIEVWMPASGWNGKFEAVGNGGWAGSISYPSLVGAVNRGYASASTDTGHKSGGGDASWALGHPEKVVDFGYRAVHEMTVKAKAIIAAFYGHAPKLSYWYGCSSGGKQGLKEAQRYPNDYDGIVAGAPANYWTHLMTSGIWVANATLKDQASHIPPAKYALIHRAVLEACDALDAVKDGILNDPRRCHFDPATLLCSGEESATCLTKPQVDAVKKIYSPVTNPRTHAAIFPGLEPGSEPGWGAMAAGPQPFPISVSHFRYLVFDDPNWDFRKFDFDKDVVLTDSKDHDTLNAIDPDLGAFKKHGGKLILYHGWVDQLIAPQNTINYYESVLARMGPKQNDFIRLFLAPGMAHCAGGPGPNRIEAIEALEQWVEKGVAPDKIIATHSSGGAVDMSRPLCPYPQAAVWNGAGSPNDAANFTCQDSPR